MEDAARDFWRPSRNRGNPATRQAAIAPMLIAAKDTVFLAPLAYALLRAVN